MRALHDLEQRHQRRFSQPRAPHRCKHAACGRAGCPFATFGGPTMRALHDLVQRNQRRFSAPPLGPLGALLSVDDTRWAGAIEAALKSHFLESWIVDNRADQRLLMVRAAVLRLHMLGCADEALPGVLDRLAIATTTAWPWLLPLPRARAA